MQPRIRWQEEGDLVVLLTPRFDKRGVINRLMRYLFGEGTVRVKLDAMGSFVWKRCDGETTLQAVIRAFEANFGEQAEQAEARTRMFLTKLYQEGWIAFYDPSPGE